MLDKGLPLREWTGSGPCFVRGRVVRETAAFVIVTGTDDRTNAKGPAERRLKKDTNFHTALCARCHMNYGN